MKILRIGSDAFNDVVLNKQTVSAIHAVITVYPSGKIAVNDLNSVNGTFINNNKIISETEIRKGDILKIDKYRVDWEKYCYTGDQLTTYSRKRRIKNLGNGFLIFMLAAILIFIIIKLYSQKPGGSYVESNVDKTIHGYNYLPQERHANKDN